MNQGKLESTPGSDDSATRSFASPDLAAAATCFVGLALCVICALDLPQGRQILSACEAVIEAAIAVRLCRHIVMHKNSPKQQATSAGLAFALICFSLAQVPQISKTRLLSISDNLLVQSSLCSCLALGGICYVFIASAKSSRADALYWTIGGAIALTLYGIQYRYLLSDISYVDSSPGFSSISTLYAVLSAICVAFAILHSLRTLDKFEFALSSSVMLMFALDFAERYNLVHVRNGAATIAQCLCVLIVLGLHALFARKLPPNMTCSGRERSKTAEWMSVRVIFGMFLFFANVVLLVGILVADLLTIQSALHATILLLLLFCCWVMSNMLALKVSLDMRSLLAAMPSSKSFIASDKILPHAVGRPIGGRTLMAEVDAMISRFNSLVNNANELVDTLIREKRNEAMIEQAQQVAHDIRSPLAAFNIVLPDLVNLPEDTRVMLRNAIFRIQDIAGTLLESGRRKNSERSLDSAGGVVMISGLIESVVCEKRVQFRDRLNVCIENAADASSYAIFSGVSSVELKRILSNLVNNAVEAVSPRGSVTISASSDAEHVLLDVRDDGPGIPDEVLSSLGKRGATLGKADGHGLGLFHACSTLRDWGGALTYTKPEGGGTRARVSLPRTLPPDWFLKAIDLSNICQVVIVDDDLSIHGIWDERLSRAGLNNIPRIHLSTAADFLSWCRKNLSLAQSTYVLMDYELVGSAETGLQLFRQTPGFNRRALVTSRTEEPNVLKEARLLDVPMVPKEAAAFVPIIGPQPVTGIQVDAVLIDDDPLIHSAWRLAGRRGEKRIQCFGSPKDFMNVIEQYSRQTPVFIDQNLQEGMKGSEVAKEIHSLGFSKVYLQTGEDLDSFDHNDCITEVVGKEPPSWLLRVDTHH